MKRISWTIVEAGILKSEKIPAIKERETRRTVLRAVKDCLKTAKSVSRPKGVSVKRRVVGRGADFIKLEGGITLSSKWLASYLKGASHICIFAVTIGKALEETASSYMEKGEALKGYLIDRIGSFACESLAASTEEELRRYYAAKGISISARLSPGYCDWPIEEQFKLAGLLRFSRIGIALNKNCMMTPKKSITAIAGLGPKGLFKKSGSQCGKCGKKDCDYRRDY